jgi:hypothetical protein
MSKSRHRPQDDSRGTERARSVVLRQTGTLAPAAGERILARGRVVKAGRTLTLVQTEVFANTGGQEKLIALLTATLMAVKGRDGISD